MSVTFTDEIPPITKNEQIKQHKEHEYFDILSVVNPTIINKQPSSPEISSNKESSTSTPIKVDPIDLNVNIRLYCCLCPEPNTTNKCNDCCQTSCENHKCNTNEDCCAKQPNQQEKSIDIPVTDCSLLWLYRLLCFRNTPNATVVEEEKIDSK